MQRALEDICEPAPDTAGYADAYSTTGDCAPGLDCVTLADRKYCLALCEKLETCPMCRPALCT